MTKGETDKTTTKNHGQNLSDRKPRTKLPEQKPRELRQIPR